MEKNQNKINKKSTYFKNEAGMPIGVPNKFKNILSRILLPLLTFLSREQSLKLGLVPLDDERVIMALHHTKGKSLDIGCGANHYIRSYGNGVGVDVYPWEGVDKVVKNSAKLPFKNGEFKTVALLACLNHIPNREEVLNEAYRVTDKNGLLLVTMISPRWGQFIHWIRFRNDPDHQDRDIDHDRELLGMHPMHVKNLIKDAGFKNTKIKKFVYGINTLYISKKE